MSKEVAMKQADKIKLENAVDLSLLSNGQLQCLAEEYEELITNFYKIKRAKKPP